ncbi:hypothetical protein IP98_02564 [Flavobacterium cauense R2A-7]|uniref:Uncharacterized protein n=1 Tax=Flavobacterium cauense R2A-7 TaxID=1341154 RepID=A0A562LNJ8_9FLAO|nr:hypothetical protein [Flavobacterium cauense]KGO79826.1 hypothetical protein Q762_13700 [Flavobacterium cauense R2A-7]TWI09209.1 hypothetical protein IP98_02564 [Flavobacterium cauense R2A-7]
MELHTIEKLVEKYFSGETSVAEEKQLKDYFSSSDVAPHLEQYRAVFGYFRQAKQEQFTKTVPLHPRKHSYVVWITVAASVAVLLGTFYIMNHKPEQPQDLGTFDNPELAFEETQKALNMVSENVNEGVKSINYVNEYNQTTKTIFK